MVLPLEDDGVAQQVIGTHDTLSGRRVRQLVELSAGGSQVANLVAHSSHVALRGGQELVLGGILPSSPWARGRRHNLA